MRKCTLLKYAVLTALCLFTLGACGSDTPEVQEKGSYWDTQEFDNLSGSDFVKVGESGQMQLLVEPSTGTVRWLDTSTGIYQDSNMSHDEGLEAPTNVEQADMVVRYFSGSTNANKLYYSTSSYDSYTMCVTQNQLSYQLIDNGVRILYMLGSDDITYQYFPRRISDDRMQELVIQYLDSDQVTMLEERYYSQLSGGDWLRNFNTGENADSSKLGAMATKEIYNLFYEVGHYTEEELYADLETWEAVEADYPNTFMIKVPVEYYLDSNGALVVNVDTSLMESDAKHPINQLQLLPYFLTSDSTNDAEEGYMFIPDGSGALIYLDSTKTREYHYSASYYGGDQLIGATTYNSVDNQMMLPVFGMKTSKSTVFGVIEEGAEAATLDAYVSGTHNSEPFSKMILNFDIQSQQSISSGAKGTNGDFIVYRASNDVYDDQITIRYYWLGEDADYVDMANCYADYLENQGVLTAGNTEDTSLVVELMGSTDKTKFMLGVPYEGTQVLTSFSQAQEILKDLTEEGISNVKLIYSGMVNGGMNQRSLASGVKYAKGMGGNSAFKKLKNYADSVGAQIFPSLHLQTAYTKEKLNNSLVAWNITNQRAQIYTFDPVINAVEDEADYPRYVINPLSMEKYLSKVKKSYSKRTGLDTMASSDLFTFIATNYKDNHASASTGEVAMKSAVENFAEGMTLMLSNPVADAYKYCTYLTDIPTQDSGMRVLDASIPFVQMVLDGYKTYSTESLNRESTDVYVNFMRAIECKGQPKFTFMYEDSSLLSGTEQENYFAVDYSYWKDKISAYYEEYNAFYNQVKDAQITGHELYERNDDLRVVTYSNGVKIYFNYSDLEETIDGVKVPAFSYVIK